MLTDPGCVRQRNEDYVTYILSDEAESGQQFRMMAVVADGMGGHAAGDFASLIAATTVIRLYNTLSGSPTEVLRTCMTQANTNIIKHAQNDPLLSGMGTTCTVLTLKDNRAYLAHIGDSRAYLLRGNKMHQISEDHSVVAHLIKTGRLSPADASNSLQRGVILRALGTEPTIEPFIPRDGFPLLAGDVLVMCSDGLTDVVDDPSIHATAAKFRPDEACRRLIEQAIAAGGPDNISVGVFAFADASRPRPEMSATRPLQRASATRPLQRAGGDP